VNHTTKKPEKCRSAFFLEAQDFALSVGISDKPFPIVKISKTPTGKTRKASQLLRDKAKRRLAQNMTSNESTEPKLHHAVTNDNPLHFGQLVGNALVALIFCHVRIVASSQCGQIFN
jgi:hypothetical protein